VLNEQIFYNGKFCRGTLHTVSFGRRIPEKAIFAIVELESMTFVPRTLQQKRSVVVNFFILMHKAHDRLEILPTYALLHSLTICFFFTYF
jgi:hypothetical protein